MSKFSEFLESSSYAGAGIIEISWISGTNPLVSLPNFPRVRDILTKKELFVICQDIFMRESAAIADVVFPAAQWGEKTGCFTNADRTVHTSLKAIEPPGEAKPDLEIFLDFSKKWISGVRMAVDSPPGLSLRRCLRLGKSCPLDDHGITVR